MYFQYPLALLLLGLIPLVVFMRRRRPPVRVPVANLYLWTQASSADTTALARRLRRHWLLVLQIVLLALVAFSAAGPRLDVGAVPVAVILDASITMRIVQDDTSRFDTAREQLKSQLEDLPGATSVRLIVADPRPHLVGEFQASDDTLRRAIDALQPSDTDADLTAAIEYARSAPVPPARIYVFSDTRSPEHSANPDIDWSLVGRPAGNIAITNLSTRRPLAAPREMEALVTIFNDGESATSGDLVLAIDGEQVGERRVTVSGRDRENYSFSFREGAGVLTAHLEQNDALRADNVRGLVLQPRASVQVFLTGEPGLFLERALEAHPDVSLVASSAEADVIVCNACTDVPAGTANVLLMAAQSPAASTPAVVMKSATEHQVTEGIDLDGTLALVDETIRATAGTVIALAGGIPAVLAEDTGTRRILEVRLDSDNGPFPLSTAFPLLVSNAVGWLSNRDENRVVLTAGEPLQWRVGEQQRSPSVIGPDDRAVPSVFANGVLSVADTRIAGLYRINLDAGEQVIAINPAIRAEPRALPAAVAPSARGEAPDATRLATDLTALTALAALLMLGVEWIYGFTGSRVL